LYVIGCEGMLRLETTASDSRKGGVNDLRYTSYDVLLRALLELLLGTCVR